MSTGCHTGDRIAGVLCLIALGSNLGDRLGHLRSAVSQLTASDGVNLLGASRLYETAPVGGPGGQGPFLNAAVHVRTNLSARALLDRLHAIEATRARERVVHWGPRTLDLDLLTYGDLVRDELDLAVPHPRLHLRRFVLEPVCDLTPHLENPRTGQTMRADLQALAPEPDGLSVLQTEWCLDLLNETR